MKEKYNIISGIINRALMCFNIIVAIIIAYPQSLFFRKLMFFHGALIILNIVIIAIINIKPKKDEK